MGRHHGAPAALSATTRGPTAKEHGGINTVWHAGRLLALDEIGRPWQLDPATLETIGRFDWDGRWSYPFTHHPKIDVRTGEMITFGYQAHARPYLQYAVVDAAGELGPIVPIDLPRGVMSHDIAITERYSVLIDVPIVFSRTRALLGGSQFAFDPSHGARFGVLPRHATSSSEVRWFSIKPCAIIHVLAAWEEDDEIVVVAPRIEHFDMGLSGVNATAPGVDTTSYVAMKREVPLLFRWRLDLRTGMVTEERLLDPRSVEFPRVNDDRMGQPIRFGYCMAAEMDRTIKLNLETGRSWEHRHGPGLYGFEMMFVPHPAAESEDHGWLMGYVWDREKDTSDAVILDARNFEAPPVARIRLPQRVPMGPHGVWIPREELPARNVTTRS